MANILQIEKEILTLSRSEREHVALAAWESLTNDVDAVSDPSLDQEGYELAESRDAALEQDKMNTLDQGEFRKRTGGDG